MAQKTTTPRLIMGGSPSLRRALAIAKDKPLPLRRLRNVTRWKATPGDRKLAKEAATLLKRNGIAA